MIRMIAAAALVVLTGTAIGTVRAQAVRDGAPNVIVVKMVDKSATEFAFEPAEVTVRAGDVIRFEQTVATPHNVDLRSGSLKGTLSPYLTAPGQTWDLKIDDRFAAGTYEYVCTPHEFMGMKGKIIVQ